jgi:hypothetical protein
MTDRELAQQADAAARATTITYQQWLKNVGLGKYPATGPPSQFGILFGLLEQIDAAPPAPLFGADLFAKYPEPAKPTGPTYKLANFTEFKNAWTNPEAGADYTGEGRVFTGTGSVICPVKSSKTTRFRHLTVKGGISLRTEATHLHLGNTMNEPMIIQGASVDGLKLESGSQWVSWDGLICEDNKVQGILVGSGGTPAVTDIRGVNFITRRNGGNANKDHGLYAANLLRFLLGNWVSNSNQAYCGQLYPQARDGHIVNYTADAGTVRGGNVYGTETGNPEPTKNIRTIGAIATYAPAAGGWDRYKDAPGCTVEDSQWWNNSAGGVNGLTSTRVTQKDPKYVNRATGDFTPRDVITVAESNWGWLLPTDINGKPRGPHPGALAAA